ncbi:XdhC/CoxI family protein [Chitinophaga agrisoli]|uniref:XdhC/CoxI family protein n=1 Tax=Chitinophaga agrisoli TaxID=2607653 RepID=A0A5B2VRW0_9BACT|nr:XdhC/CoxI family protein [Chitinophaga agrisoli]KAA2241360.1 XdhC/CoxI family protein [Chitinophaga agrisoli]
MNKQLRTWQLINEALERDLPVMLLYVLQSHGSSPGRPGFFMAVNAAGGMEGSIGGGMMEHKFVEMAKERLQHAAEEDTIRKQVHNKNAVKDQSGMICSGEQTILLHRVLPEDAPAIQNIIACLQQLRQGGLQLSPEGLHFGDSFAAGKLPYFDMVSEEDWVYQENIGYTVHLFIVGGGHCALALSRLMNSMGFYIHVFDDRPELHTVLQNEYAHEKHTLPDYSGLREAIPAGNQHYVVVMTFGYRTDDIAIRALLDRKFKYFGVLGSKSKIEQMFNAYMEEGIPAAQLYNIYAPVGLAINSHTPEEIAISIAAEIIQVKNQDE